MYTYILVLFFGAVGSIVLPGPCPNVPPTHFNCSNFSGDIMTSEIIFIIPFAPQRPSYMFKNYNGTVPLATKNINFMQNSSKIIFEFSSLITIYPFYSRSVGFIETKNPSIAMNTTVYKKFPRNHGSLVVSKCDSIVEDIRLWCDGQFFLVWSCYNNVWEHDEALILLVSPIDPNSTHHYQYYYTQYDSDINMYNEMMQRFNATWKKYLGQSEILLGDHFEWKRTPEYKRYELDTSLYGSTLFPCAHQKTFDPILAIAMIVLLGVGIWCAGSGFLS